jgi:hypothetical protein
MKHIKTKYILPAAVCLLAFQACKQQVDYKAIRKEIINIHDTIMNEDGKLMADQSMLKSMIAPASLAALKKANNGMDTTTEKLKATTLIRRLDSVSNAMSDWMGKFNPDVQGKNVQQAADYFGIERIKVSQLDSSYKDLLKTAGDYLKQFHLKAADSSAMKMKM